MKDQVLICTNCQNEFLFSTGEQQFYQSKNLPNPTLCPICRSIKAQEKKIPSKPQKTDSN